MNNKKWLYLLLFIAPPLAFALFLAWQVVRDLEGTDDWDLFERGR
jgi:hypothetical protein